jgi:TolA-binding protein
MRQHLFVLAAFASILPLAAAQGQPVVQSQEGIALENQILQLQQQVQQLQGGGGNGGSALGGQAMPPPSSSGGAPDGGMVASLLNRVDQLQSQVQQLSGEVDTLQNQVNTQHDATEKEIGDLKFQMSNGGAQNPGQGQQARGPAPAMLAPGRPQNLAAAGTLGRQGPPQMQGVPNNPPLSAAAPTSPHALLHTAQHAYAQHDYAGAEAAARAILAHAGSSPEAYPAQFLLAQSLAAEGRPQDAAIAYDNAYNRNRAGAEAPASLLGLASSLAAIHQNEAACDTLSSLTSQFPSLPDGMASRVAAVRHRARCS